MIAGPKREVRFTNSYGERFVVRVHPSGKSGEFLGDETDWQPIDIRHDRVLGSFMLGADEYDALAEAWREMTGRTLQKPLFLEFVEMWAALSRECKQPA